PSPRTSFGSSVRGTGWPMPNFWVAQSTDRSWRFMARRACRGETMPCPRQPKGEPRLCQYESISKPNMGAMRRPRIFQSSVPRVTIGGSIENGDRTGPAGRPGAHLDRKAAHLEALRGQLFEIVQLLEMAIADLAAGLVAFPDQARVARLGEFLRRMHERRVPAPAVCSGDPNAALEQIERRLAPHAAAGCHIMRLAVGGAGISVHQHDLERFERMADALELRFDVAGGGHIAVRESSGIELDARLEAPFERHLVDGDRALAAVHGGVKMVGRVEMGAIVSHERDQLDRPALAVG